MELDGGILSDDGVEFGGGREGEGKVVVAAEICCSICLEAVSDDGKRSSAKLKCGHQFHLGAMKCPNCRNVENGRWLYSTRNRSNPIPNHHPYQTYNTDEQTILQPYINHGSLRSFIPAYYVSRNRDQPLEPYYTQPLNTSSIQVSDTSSGSRRSNDHNSTSNTVIPPLSPPPPLSDRFTILNSPWGGGYVTTRVHSPNSLRRNGYWRWHSQYQSST